MNWACSGKRRKFGDNLGIDVDVMPPRFALERKLDQEVLRPFPMAGVGPEFANKVSPAGITVADKRFGQGSPHIQDFPGIIAHRLELIAESINVAVSATPSTPFCSSSPETSKPVMTLR